MTILRFICIFVLYGNIKKCDARVTTTTPPTYTATDRYFQTPRFCQSEEKQFQQYLNQIFSSMTYDLLKDAVIKFRHATKYSEMYHGTVNYEIGLYATEIKVVFNDMVKNYRFHSNRSRLNMFKNSRSPRYAYEQIYAFKSIATEEMFAGFYKQLSFYNQIRFLRRRFYDTIDHYDLLRRNASLHKPSTMTVIVGRKHLKSDKLIPDYDSSENSGEYDVDYFGHRIFKSTKPRRFTRKTTKDPFKYVPLREGKKLYRNLKMPAKLQQHKTVGDWNAFLDELMNNKQNYSKEAKRLRLGARKPSFRPQSMNKIVKINKPMTEEDFKRQLHLNVFKKSVGNFSPVLEGVDIDLMGLFKK